MFHYIDEYGLTYGCLTDSKYRSLLALKFLNTVKEDFLDRYSEYQIKKAVSYSFKGFDKKVKRHIDFYNSDEADVLKNALN